MRCYCYLYNIFYIKDRIRIIIQFKHGNWNRKNFEIGQKISTKTFSISGQKRINKQENKNMKWKNSYRKLVSMSGLVLGFSEGFLDKKEIQLTSV